MTKISLPYPPSANKLWKPVGYGRMIKTAEYRLWMKEAAWIAAMAARDQGQLLGPYKLLILACPTLKRCRDVDNIVKPTSDAIKNLLVEDDSLCQEITVRWTALDEPGLMVHVEPTEAIPCRPLKPETRKWPNRPSLRVGKPSNASARRLWTRHLRTR